MARTRRTAGNITWRVWAVVTLIAIGALVITARLVQLQIIDHGTYAHEARLTHLGHETVLDRRGALLDRNGYPLAGSEDTFDVMVERDAWLDSPDAAAAAAQISRIVGAPAAQMVDAVVGTDVYETAVARGLNLEQAQQVRKLGLDGVRLLRSSHRVYPEGNLAAQLLGFVGRDDIGLTGLEADLDAMLGGARGSLTYERDGLGNELSFGDRREVPASPGTNVVLTIDRYIQRLAEVELARAIKEHKASGGTIIVVQPKTGEILAMASRPTFDLAKPDLSDETKVALFRNRAVTDMYEPGSVFKLVTTAGGLDSGAVSPGSWWFDSGEYNVSGWSIRNWDLSAHGSQTVQQMLSKSLNTGAAWVAQQVGSERFYQYIDRFGFGRPTEIGLSGEAGGSVRTPDNDPEWQPVDMATNSFGQGISVTPLQMTMAVATIANDGLVMKPQIVKRFVSPLSSQSVAPESRGQAISAESAQTLRQMMGVVVDGIPTTYLDIQGYRVGGKTGTANITSEDGGYKPGAYISSFVGIAPLEDPQLAVLVKIDEPKDVPWGTVVAAPAFGSLVQAALAYLKVPPTEQALVSSVQ